MKTDLIRNLQKRIPHCPPTGRQADLIRLPADMVGNLPQCRINLPACWMDMICNRGIKVGDRGSGPRWKDALSLSNELFDLAERAEQIRKYRFAEQLNGAAMSITNNISEGSATATPREFARYLTISRNSLFEVVNILYIYEMRGLISNEEFRVYYLKLLTLSKKIFSFRKKILPNS